MWYTVLKAKTRRQRWKGTELFGEKAGAVSWNQKFGSVYSACRFIFRQIENDEVSKLNFDYYVIPEKVTKETLEETQKLCTELGRAFERRRKRHVELPSRRSKRSG